MFIKQSFWFFLPKEKMLSHTLIAFNLPEQPLWFLFLLPSQTCILEPAIKFVKFTLTHFLSRDYSTYFYSFRLIG